MPAFANDATSSIVALRTILSCAISGPTVECVLALIEEVVEDAAGRADGGLAVAGDVPREAEARSLGEERHVVIPARLLPREPSLEHAVGDAA